MHPNGGEDQPQRSVIAGVRQPLASARNPIVAATAAGNAVRRPNLSHPTNLIPNRRANSVSSRPRPIIGTHTQSNRLPVSCVNTCKARAGCIGLAASIPPFDQGSGEPAPRSAGDEGVRGGWSADAPSRQRQDFRGLVILSISPRQSGVPPAPPSPWSGEDQAYGNKRASA